MKFAGPILYCRSSVCTEGGPSERFPQRQAGEGAHRRRSAPCRRRTSPGRNRNWECVANQDRGKGA